MSSYVGELHVKGGKNFNNALSANKSEVLRIYNDNNRKGVQIIKPPITLASSNL